MTLPQLPHSKPRLLAQVRHHLRLKHYSIRTEETYVQAIRRFILFHHKRHPREMGAGAIRQYLSHLANHDHVTASTQNVVLAALLFLYREVLGIEIEYIDGVARAKRPVRVPTVMLALLHTHRSAKLRVSRFSDKQRKLSHLKGTEWSPLPPAGHTLDGGRGGAPILPTLRTLWTL